MCFQDRKWRLDSEMQAPLYQNILDVHVGNLKRKWKYEFIIFKQKKEFL